MSTTESSKNIDQLLSHLQKINEHNLINVFVPSVNDTVKFKQLTVKQQSSLITGVITQEADKNAFSYNRSTSTIINENNVESVDIKVTDRGPVLAQLRKDTLGSELDIGEVTYDIADLEYKLAQDSIDLITNTHTYSMSGMSVSYTTPSMNVDVALNADAEEKWVEEEGVDIIAELFKLELAKFITNVTVNEDVHIVMSDLKTNDKIKVCDALPVKITRHVMSYIQDVKSLEQELMRLDESTFIPTDITLFST